MVYLSAPNTELKADEEIMRKSEFRDQKSEIRNQRSEVGSRGFLLIAVLCLLTSGAFASETQGDVDGVRAALEKWVETRKVISQEQRDWALSREMLNERIDLVQQEIDSLKEKISDAEQSIGEADKKREELVEKNDELKNASSALNRTVLALEENTQTLLKRLPDPIRERVKPLSQRIPEDVEETRLSLAERFQNIIGILNEVNKFSREITLTSEVRSLPDGTSAEVTAMYVGIGQAYYAGTDGKIAGTGTSSADGWQWTADNSIAAEISQAIAILKNEQVASFVQLPVEIK
jgi:DNA repair exonuclease SbcCD ATPase subunit